MDAGQFETTNPSTKASGKKRAVLIVQTNPLTLSSLERCLSRHFDAVHLASCTEDAERHFARGANPSHVVCGHELGAGAPTGSAMIARWRARYSSIERAILATGAEVETPVGGAVDAVFRKPASPKDLLALL